MHIADFLSKTFTDKGEEQKQQRDASTSQADNINILETEDMEHADALESTRVTEQNRELTKQDSQLQVLKVTILAGWPDTKNERPQCIRAYRPYRDKLTVHNGVIFRGNCHHFKSILRPGMLTILVSHL